MKENWRTVLQKLLREGSYTRHCSQKLRYLQKDILNHGRGLVLVYSQARRLQGLPVCLFSGHVCLWTHSWQHSVPAAGGAQAPRHICSHPNLWIDLVYPHMSNSLSIHGYLSQSNSHIHTMVIEPWSSWLWITFPCPLPAGHFSFFVFDQFWLYPFQSELSVCMCVCVYVYIYIKQTGSKQEKEYVKAVYCHPAYLTSMQSTS